MAAIQFPVQAVEWSCHAAPTIKDVSGAVIAEVSNHGRSARADEAIAAEIVRRLNAHDDMLAALLVFEHAMESGAVDADLAGALSVAQAAIAKAQGGAA